MELQPTLDFLQKYSGAFSALLTLCLLLLNVFSVGIAFYLARENRLLRRAGTDPDVMLYLIGADRYPTLINMVLANVGKGPARNIRVSHDATQAELAEHNVAIRNLKLFEGWGLLPQGERVEFFFGSGPDLLKEPSLRALRFTVHYQDIRGCERNAEFRIDASEFEGMATVGHPAEHESAEALKKIADAVESWSGSRRLKVETITTREVQREQREWIEQHRQRREGDAT
jgi:hypothetical protein